MSGHLQFCLLALLFTGLSSSPASSNPFDALFNTRPAEATAAAPPPSPAEEECLRQPGKSTADGRHWVYRYDGHRKCWFEAEGSATVKKPPLHAAKHRAVAANEHKPELLNRRAVVDARDELPGSAQPVTPQQTSPVTEIKVVDAAAVPATGHAELVPPAPAVAEPATVQFTPDHPTPDRSPSGQVDVEALLTAGPSAGDAVAGSAPPVGPTPVLGPEAAELVGWWRTTWVGLVMIALGLVSVLGSTWIARTGRGGRGTSPLEHEVYGLYDRRSPERSFGFTRNAFKTSVVDEPLFRPQNARPAI